MALNGDSAGVESRRENRDDGADECEGDRADELEESSDDRSTAALYAVVRVVEGSATMQRIIRWGRTEVAPAFLIFSYCFRRDM